MCHANLFIILIYINLHYCLIHFFHEKLLEVRLGILRMHLGDAMLPSLEISTVGYIQPCVLVSQTFPEMAASDGYTQSACHVQLE